MTDTQILVLCAVVGALGVLARPVWLLYRCTTRLDRMLDEWPSLGRRVQRIERRLGIDPDEDDDT